MRLSLAVCFVLINMIAVVALAASPFVFFSIYAGEGEFLNEILKISDPLNNSNKLI